jgi:predicted regulator of Ras-like GTPase activity (Roadblock/LC7/MglB family)
MPVSPLTVEPYVAPRPDTVAPPKPGRSIAPLEPVAAPEPLAAPLDPDAPLPAPAFEPAAPPAPLTVPEPVMPRAPEPVASRLLDPLAALEALTAPTPSPPPAAAPEPAVRDAESTPASESSLPSPAATASQERARAATDGAAAILAQFATMDGVQWAVLADREGFVVESSANAGVDADVAAALSACLAESSDGLGRELDRGGLHGIILEYERGMVVVYGVGTSGLLAVGLGESAVLGKVRYFARKSLAELARAV